MKQNILKRESIYNLVPFSNNKELYVVEATYRKSQPDVSKKEMSKPYYALHLFLKGSGTLITPGQTYTIEANDIWVRFPGENIRYFDSKETSWSYIFIAFQGSLAPQLMARLSLNRENRVFKTTDKLTEIFSFCITECKKNPHCKDLLANAYLNMILAELAVMRQEKSEKKYTVPSEYVEKAIDYIDNNLSSPTLNAHELSAFLNLNKDYFLRIFKNEMNIPFSDYIITKRLNRATHLIEHQKETSIAKIAESVGYSDAAYFSYSFKKIYALSPSEYIKKLSAEV